MSIVLWKNPPSNLASTVAKVQVLEPGLKS